MLFILFEWHAIFDYIKRSIKSNVTTWKMIKWFCHVFNRCTFIIIITATASLSRIWNHIGECQWFFSNYGYFHCHTCHFIWKFSKSNNKRNSFLVIRITYSIPQCMWRKIKKLTMCILWFTLNRVMNIQKKNVRYASIEITLFK